MPAISKTIAVLYPGEMGVAVATLLAFAGHHVVTTLEDRSPRSAERCRETGITVLPTLRQVVESADVVISLVPPAAAEDIARKYCKSAKYAPAGAVYVDANSIGPDLAERIGSQIEQTGVDFVDGAINGLARNLATSCTFFVSGPRGKNVVELLGGAMKVRDLGDQPGRASAMKMLLSGLSKGVCALFVETALVAHHHGMLGEMMESYSAIYPGVMGIVERMMPTYPLHAERRADEMHELEQTAIAADLDPRMLTAARQVHELLAETQFGKKSQSDWTVADVINTIAAAKLFSASESAEPSIVTSDKNTNALTEKCHGN